MTTFILLALTIFSLEKGDLSFQVEAETTKIDPARSIFLTVKSSVPSPDFRDRARGFSLAEEIIEEPILLNGKKNYVTKWRLVPEPSAKVYKIAPFVVGDYVAGPIHFQSPDARAQESGAMEIEVRKDLPPLSWRLVGFIALALSVLSIIVFLIVKLFKFIARCVKEHRMSPIERAWLELDRLLKKDLPTLGRFKDFYVELTLVVRRYVQRRYGIKAPHLTTEEFLQEATKNSSIDRARLAVFLEAADMVKFAGLKASKEMAEEATASASSYLKEDGRLKEKT